MTFLVRNWQGPSGFFNETCIYCVSLGRPHRLQFISLSFATWVSSPSQWTWVDYTGCNSSHLASVREYLVQASQMDSLYSCLTSVSRPHTCFSSEWLTLTKFLAFKAVSMHISSLPISLKNSPVFQRRGTLQTCFVSVPGFLFQRDRSLTNVQKRELFPDQNVHCMTELLRPWCVSQALCKAVKEILLYL